MATLPVLALTIDVYWPRARIGAIYQGPTEKRHGSHCFSTRESVILRDAAPGKAVCVSTQGTGQPMP